MRYLLKCMLLTVSLILPARVCLAVDNQVMNFGVVPQQSASKMAKLWNPLLEQLGKQTDIKFRFKTAPDIPTFEQRVLKGEYDVVYMNPYHYTVFHEKPGYRAIVHAKGKKINGIIVVHKDSSYRTLRDLENQNLAFPSPAAFAATLLTETKLKKDNITYTHKYVSSHDSVYRNVAAKRFAAGGGVIRTLKSMEKKFQDQLRILWKSPGYTPHAVAVHPKLDPGIADDIQKALQTMHTSEAGMTALQNIRVKGFSMAKDADWDDVRSLNINYLDKLLR